MKLIRELRAEIQRLKTVIQTSGKMVRLLLLLSLLLLLLLLLNDPLLLCRIPFLIVNGHSVAPAYLSLRTSTRKKSRFAHCRIHHKKDVGIESESFEN